ncbi:MAG: 50S ribosomal protein L10 [Candidatus Marinimicrobia bacterium]|nr:50S ribosomal protein L10 [Candidatus Neomarinimicrobiota bacterium]MBL7046722.1 50S ribosomal protein L10 [Candidatus Neomarinimicrobiota bacterium]
MPSENNIEVVAAMKEKFENATGVYFTDFMGLNVSEVTDLRKKFYSEGVEYLVVKNTLVKLASKDLKIKELEDIFRGPTAIAFSYQDPTTPARVLKEFKKEHDLPELKALIFEGELMDKSLFEKISNLPSREVLLSNLVGGLNSPMTKFVTTISSPISKLLNVLSSIKETKQT